MRLIDADALVDALMTYTWRDEDERLIDDADEKREYIKQWLPDLPTVGVGMAEALECFRRQFSHDGGIICEQKKCKWRCEGRNVGLDYGYCAWNNLLGDVVRLLGGIPGEGVVLRGKID